MKRLRIREFPKWSANKWQRWHSNSRVFSSNVWKHTLFLLCQPGLKNKISAIYSQLLLLFHHFFLFFPPFFYSLPFSLLCCVLTCIWDPYSSSLLDQSRILKHGLCMNLWHRDAEPENSEVPNTWHMHAVILGDWVGGPFLYIKKVFGCPHITAQHRHTSVPTQSHMAQG